jgi:uncharacterized membrane protein YfcA
MDFLTTASQSDLGVFALGLVIAGVVGGLIAGMLGVGGGIVIVPVLYHVLAGVGISENLRMHIAVGTSLATIIPTSISSLRAHARRGNVDWALLRSWVVPMIAGVAIGTALASTVSGRTLSLIFGIVALPVAVNMALGKEDWRLADHLPTGPGGWAIATGIGWLSSMMGIGGGTLGVPIMSHCNYPIHRAVGTASAFGVIISIPAAMGMAIGSWNAPDLPPYSLGFVNLLGFILIAPASVLMAPLGAHLAHSMDKQRLRRVFALFIAITAGRMLWDVFG